MDELIEALTILNKDPDASFAVGHDQIYAGGAQDKVSEEDAERLKALGWFIDEESYSRFV